MPLKPGHEYRVFKIGEEVSIPDDRRRTWQPKEPQRIKHIDLNAVPFEGAAGHPQTLHMTNGNSYSGLWFDENATMRLPRPDCETPEELKK